MLITSGDVIIDFETYLLPDKTGDICVFTKPATLEQGSRHGVFQPGKEKHTVIDFF